MLAYDTFLRMKAGIVTSVHIGSASLYIQGPKDDRRFVMSKRGGEHSLSVETTSFERLSAHFKNFCETAPR